VSEFSAQQLLDLEHFEYPGLFVEGEPVWTALSRIKPYLAEHVSGQMLEGAQVDERAVIGPNVILGEGVIVEANATIKGPAILGPGCTVRSGAYVRENVIAGAGVMLGNSCEFKNCVIFDNAEVPHFNYVGDSILGYKAHLGAGVVLSNVRLDRKSVVLKIHSGAIETGLRKFGAIIGDRTEIGCNSVLSPGSILGRDCILYPGTQWNGVLDSNRIVKLRQSLEIVEKI
jgi:NDP-sugar pyrophosphorylase family protein